MTKTLAGLTLMKEISKWSKTLQEYRLGDGENNPGARISKISLNLRRSEFPTEWDKLALRLEWCGGVFHPWDQAVEQGEWIFHHWVSPKGLYNKTPKLNGQEQ